MENEFNLGSNSAAHLTSFRVSLGGEREGKGKELGCVARISGLCYSRGAAFW